MTLEQGAVFAVIVLTLVMLALELWRYDLVALMGMLLLVILRIIPANEAFAGFGDSAVVTIAAVLVCSRGLQNSGVADLMAKWMSMIGNHLSLQLVVMCGVVIFSSAFMNNIGALAIFIPVAIRVARRSERSASLYLLPMAFSAHLGGLMTLIGTPPNLIVSSLRVEYVGEAFGMFEFAPVGLALSVVVVAFISLLGWRLVPRREEGKSGFAQFVVEDYVSEVLVPPESPLAGCRIRGLGSVSDADVWVVGIERDGERLPAPSAFTRLKAGDDLLVRAEAEALRQFVHDAQLELAESKPINSDADAAEEGTSASLLEALQSDEIKVVEAVVGPDSRLRGRTARALSLRDRYGVNVLAVSRPRAQIKSMVGDTVFKSGDVLLIQGPARRMSETLTRLGCLPLAERGISLGQPQRVALAIGIFGTALLASTLGLLAIPAAMTAAACGMVATGLVSLREAYEHIDWPIVILVGAMLAMGAALESTGGDQLIADQILRISHHVAPAVLLVVVLLLTMFLSDLVNNTAAVVLMASIGISVARGLGISLDPFLVAVAIGGACAFLTPIGHESNVLVFEVGGFEFSDFWRLGLPLELLIVVVAVPLLLWLWPM